MSIELAIDLGTHSTLVWQRGRGLVMKEPSVVAVNQRSGKVVAVGDQAIEAVRSKPIQLALERPLRGGTVTDFQLTYDMMSALYARFGITRLSRATVIVSVPNQATEVERSALRDAATRRGSPTVHFMEEPLAAAIGAKLPVQDPVGSMVVDIGGGNTEASVVSMGGIVLTASDRIGGLDLDEMVQSWLRDYAGIGVGDRTAEQVKHALGRAWPTGTVGKARVRGRDLNTGETAEVVVSSEDMRMALDPGVTKIVRTVVAALGDSPPELAQDIMSQGIVLTGGGAMLTGLDERITAETQVRVRQADDPTMCVIHGIGAALESGVRWSGIFEE